ncbi:MAG: alpha/beta hydrolase [Anaerolineales bacterium]|nr:alpha/beta hydrolase [Anaerolineales bacterium]
MNTHWTQNDVLVNGIKLHYTRTGHGDKPPLVLVHGFSDNGLLWTPTARDLESEYDVIMPDMRGHGLSARVQPNENVDMAADVAELIRTLGIERPIIGGHSMGAIVAYQVGLRFPELASAIFLEDPGWWISSPNSVSPAENPIVIWAKSLPHKTMEELLIEYHQNHPNWSEEMIQLMCQSKTQIDANIAEIMSARMHAKEWNWQTTLQNMTQPLLLITADPELGAIVTPEVVAKVRQLNPRVTLAHVPDVGHLIRFDNYDAFMKAVRAFLKQL